jgi:hypothetical protein
MHLLPLAQPLRHHQYIPPYSDKETKFEKEKIVEGINKMYTIHVKIKEIYKHNIEIYQTLLLIKDYKTILSSKIKSIAEKINRGRDSKEHFTQDFEAQAVEFYDGLIEKI